MTKHSTFKPIPPVIEPDIFKKINPDNSRSYFSPDPSGNKPIKTYSMEFEDFFNMLFSRFEILEEMLCESDYNDFGFLLQSLNDYSRLQIRELTHFMKGQVAIEIDLIQHKEKEYRTDRVIGVSVTPVKQKE